MCQINYPAPAFCYIHLVMHVVIAGCGYVGVRLAKLLHQAGHTVYGIRRTIPADVSLLSWIQGDITNPASISLPAHIDAVVLAAGLRRDTDQRYQQLFVDGYRALLDRLATTRLMIDRVVMVSTTGVFAERDGNWITEDSPVNREHSPGRYYLEAEEIVHACPFHSVTVRLSGIYGPERIRLVREVREGRARRFNAPPIYLNQLHADDAAGILAHTLALPRPDTLYIASDREPCDRNDVLDWIAAQCSLPSPVYAEDGIDQPSRRSGNKRCNSRRLVESGYSFIYPSFREGYRALLDYA